MSREKRVYFVEGLPGTGKSTICQWVNEQTDAACILEEDLNYPNNLENTAGIPIDIYNKIYCDFPMIADVAKQYEQYMYVNIEDVREQFENQDKLLSLLKEWDIGDEFNTYMKLSHYILCSLEYINNQFIQLEKSYDSLIFDSVWLQNPINELLSINADKEIITK